jgi:nitrous oxidase accessory protein NosD
LVGFNRIDPHGEFDMSTVRAASISSVFLLALAGQVMAATVQVGNCRHGVATFATIQAAVNASTAGGTVLVCPGTYPEQVTIDKALTLKGVESGTLDAAVVVAPLGGVVQNTTSLATGGPIAAQILVTESNDVDVSNLTIDGANNGISSTGCTPLNLIGLYYQNASGTVNHVAAVNQALTGNSTGCQVGLGIFVQSGHSGTSTVTVSNSHVENYQKNGITGNEVGTTVTITGNTVVGQGRTNGAAENSIQIGFGATGQIRSNVAMDDVWAPDTISDSADAASGILVFASSGVKVSGNTVGNTQFGIAFVSDPTSGPADGGTITGNRVSATHIFDGIELCGSSNTVHGNTIHGSDESAIHVDSSCGPVTGNVVNGNSINEACAGIMLGTAAGTNSIGSNAFFNTRNTVLTADRCTAPLAAAQQLNTASAAKSPRPSPARP